MRSQQSFFIAAVMVWPGWSATILVGPGGQYAKPCQAITAARPGDVIEIDAAGTYDGDVCAIRTANLTLRGIKGRAHLRAAGQNAQGKGIWVVAATGIVVENIEFSGARVSDRNGAGIRVDTGFGITVRNCHFHDNENGILTGNTAAADVIVEHSVFENNGFGDGMSHNIYVNHVRRFIFRGNYSARARVGHLVKSRAAENHIFFNRLSQESGSGSYEIDLSNGGRSYIIGNIIQQGPLSQNAALVAFKREGADARNPTDELFVVNNSFVNQRTPATAFIVTGPSVVIPAVVRNNIFYGPGPIITQSTAQLENNFTGEPDFTSLQNLDLRLRNGSPAIDQGVDPGAGMGLSLAPAAQYVHTACEEGRRLVGRPDLGAYEFGGEGGPGAGLPTRCATVSPPAPVALHGASFQEAPSAPGAVLSVFGESLARDLVVAGGFPLPTSLGGVTATVNGIPAPLFFVSATQINLQVPYEAAPGKATLDLSIDGVNKARIDFQIAPSSPGIFLHSTDRAVAQNQDFTLNSPQNPAPSGGVLIAYMTGQGAVDIPVGTGQAAPTDSLSQAILPARATIGGLDAPLLFLGLTPGLVALLQANLLVPDLPPGDYPLVVTIDGVDSNTALVSVGLPGN